MRTEPSYLPQYGIFRALKICLLAFAIALALFIAHGQDIGGVTVWSNQITNAPVASITNSSSWLSNTLVSAKSLIPTKADFFTRFDGSVAIGYNSEIHSGVMVGAIEASLAPNLGIGAVYIRDHWGSSGAAFSLDATGNLGNFVGTAGAGPGWDFRFHRPMAYMFIGAGYQFHYKVFGYPETFTIGVELANANNRPGSTYLISGTQTF